MRHTLARFVLALSLLIPATASAGWHIGPNFGFTHVFPTEGEGVSLLNWGAGSNILGFWQPGMRLGWSLADPRNEIYTTSGLELLSTTGTSIHAVQLSVNYQRNFAPVTSSGAFVTAGVGLLNVGGEGVSATVPVFGGGIGFVHPLAGGHGRFRGEARLDHQSEDQDSVIASATLFTLRFGFDLMN